MKKRIKTKLLFNRIFLKTLMKKSQPYNEKKRIKTELLFKRIFLKTLMKKITALRGHHPFRWHRVVPEDRSLPFHLADLLDRGRLEFRLRPFHRVVQAHPAILRVLEAQLCRDLRFLL
jgi:hypothetical protein